MTPAPVAGAAPDCATSYLAVAARGVPAVYCSKLCRPPPGRRGIVVEVDDPEISPDGQPVQRCGPSGCAAVLVIAGDLGRPWANSTAGALNDLLRPRSRQKGATIE